MKRKSLYSKILWIIVPIVVIMLVVMMVASYQISFRSQKDLFEYCMQELSEKSANEVTIKLATMTDELKWIAGEEIFTTMDDQRYGEHLNELAKEKKEYFSMIFVARAAISGCATTFAPSPVPNAIMAGDAVAIP